MARDNRSANVLLLIFGGISLVLMLLPMTGKVRYLRAAVSYLLNPVPYYGSQSYERFANMPADAARLISGDMRLREAQRALKEAKVLEAERDALRSENLRLNAAAGLTPRDGTAVRWARVMQRDPINWHRSVMIDAGSENGVELNAPVLGVFDGQLGLVGRVAEVGPKSAMVLLLTDERSEVASHIPSRESEGLVQGQGNPKLRMNYLPPEGTFELGDKVYTSPTSETFSVGLLIGTVTQVYASDPFLQFQSVEVTPAVRPSTLKEVLILVPEKAVRS